MRSAGNETHKASMTEKPDIEKLGEKSHLLISNGHAVGVVPYSLSSHVRRAPSRRPVTAVLVLLALSLWLLAHCYMDPLPLGGVFSPSYVLVRFSTGSRISPVELYSYLSSIGADVWSMTSKHADVLLTQKTYRILAQNKDIWALVMKKKSLDEDLQRERNERHHPDAAKKRRKQGWFDTYHTYDENVAWYTELAKNYSSRVRVLPEMGKTYEGRSLMVVSVSNQTNVEQYRDTLPRLYVQAGIHAREWISPITLQYIAQQLATSEKPNIVSLLNRAEILLVPHVNPDGYNYAWKQDRLWRKNRMPTINGAFGVDLNRNFDSNWGNGGSSSNPFAEDYMGPSAASELETKAIMSFFKQYRTIAMALDLHSYSQLILRPIGWSTNDTEHEWQLKKVSDKMAAIIFKKHQMEYISEKSIDLYPTTGTADDWFYMQNMTFYDSEATSPLSATSYDILPYSFTIELRPDSSPFNSGFMLPAKEIIPTGEEILPAFLHLCNAAIKNPLKINKKFFQSKQK